MEEREIAVWLKGILWMALRVGGGEGGEGLEEGKIEGRGEKKRAMEMRGRNMRDTMARRGREVLDEDDRTSEDVFEGSLVFFIFAIGSKIFVYARSDF
mmetsp:Transcript_26869/g.50925  ORF Transcript_26869/g.50925 Transcript_26869/m.50925 type:complete len:98 (-) Transcript_26869:39-332(-)